MDQCKCVASGFLANGGILGICHVKVNLKREFVYSFASLASGMGFNGQKDQVNNPGKRLRGRFVRILGRRVTKSGPDGQNLHIFHRKMAHQ
ncbi:MULTISPECIES: hypothetical protein [Enterobacter]|uniref:hypothetical protein n=1 Tax=Enterobacter TaxID=547 RepID=UPI001C63DD40|nr:hypothetical protein [Enterobacter hormaechei]EHF4989590.1 hypothetical protein [Enterobacter hormaechei]MBW7725803.1 hypothetical protein [Enterobacter hormaechei]